MPKSSGLQGWEVDDHNVSPDEASEKGSGRLVRDKIPELMRSKGGRPRTRVAGQAEYRRRLARELMEEAIGYSNDPKLEGLADVLEVVNSLCLAHRTTFARLEKVRKARAKTKGTYRKRIILDDA
jgi:predicted house-cleaning noncanonical NTP pyrophosphatase (MazG superfamily)